MSETETKLELQESIPVYVRQQVANRIKNLQPAYEASKSLRPLVTQLKNMCLREGKMKRDMIERLTNERTIVNIIGHYMNATNSLVEIAILMCVYAKAVGGAENVTFVFNAARGVHPATGKMGPVMTCSLCDNEPATCGAYVPNFGHPTGEMAYVYYTCLAHMPPTSDTADEPMRQKVMERLKLAHDQLESAKKKEEEEQKKNDA